MDLLAFFEKIESQFNQHLPFVAYRKPNTDKLIALMQKEASLYTTSDYTESGFVFAPFDSKEPTVLLPLEHSEFYCINTEGEEIPTYGTKSPIIDDKDDRTFHISLVQKGIKTIENNKLKKVVLSRKESINLLEIDSLEIFKRLLNRYPSAFVYWFYHPDVGLWLGATPETLLKIEGQKFYTTALAGTQKFEGNLNVEWNPKEKEEQNMVTNFIVDHLEPLVKNLKVENVQTAKAGNLLHLKTNISGTFDLKSFNLKEMLYTLHPTPAVCGVPKEIAKNFILEQENYKREFYTGFLGELNFKEKISRNPNSRNVENNAYSTITTVSNLFVNLRCMQLKDHEAFIYVGGGITKDSNPEAEWIETINKTQTIKSVL